MNLQFNDWSGQLIHDTTLRFPLFLRLNCRPTSVERRAIVEHFAKGASDVSNV